MMRSSLEQSSSPKPVALIIVVAVLAIGGGLAAWYFSQAPDGEEAIILTPEARAYTRNLDLSDVEMKATENVLGQTLVEITGRVTNKGDRPVKHVVLTCIFMDPYGVEAARELVPIIRSRDGVLQPGESRRFRLPFDALPATWNQAMPRLVIAQITFG